MSKEKKTRDRIITEWRHKDALGFVGPPIKPAAQHVYFKVLLEVAAADGILSEPEREWIVGFAATMGHPQELLNELETYQPGNSTDVKKYFQDADLPYVQMSGMGIISNGLRAAAADGELHEKEVEAIYALAKTLGITEEQVQKIQSLCDEEAKLRQKRLQVLFPESFDDTINEFYKHHS